jgi:hypothetical protein
MLLVSSGVRVTVTSPFGEVSYTVFVCAAADIVKMALPTISDKNIIDTRLVAVGVRRIIHTYSDRPI